MVMSDDLRLPGGGYAPASLRCTRTAVETLRACKVRDMRMPPAHLTECTLERKYAVVSC